MLNMSYIVGIIDKSLLRGESHMKISLVHFSDLHFFNKKDSILEKKEKIISAIKSRTYDAEKIVYVMNGDSAYSGKKEEFLLAFNFFVEILSEAGEGDFICVPGNHDCDFEQMDEEIRQIFIDSIKNSQEEQSSKIGKIILQDEFNNYFQTFSSFWTSSRIISESNIHKSVDYSITEGLKIRFQLFNTAWDSSLKESPGTMCMPMQELKDVSYDKEAILNISILHHPTHWNDPNNKREFDLLLNDVSDLVLSGHEHADTVFSQVSNFGETISIEGNVLQENSNKNTSGFNIIDINISENNISNINLTQFEWNVIEKIYKPSNTLDFQIDTLLRKVKNISNGESDLYIPTASMEQFVNDIGAPITHPRLGSINLQDIYVYPDFKDNFAEKESKKTIKSKEFLESIVVENGVWFIEGEKEAGKTTLLKQLYKNFLEQNKVPLYFDLKIIKDGGSLKNILKYIHKEYKNQYEGDTIERFIQLNTTNKVLLLDNWELCGLNKQGKRELLNIVLKLFNTVIIMAESSPNNASDLLGINKELETSIKFQEIGKFGYKKREELVEKWIRLGNDYILEEVEIFFEVDNYTKQVNEVIGKSYVPQVPIYILIILQSMDNGRELSDFNNQSNGYYYELLIKQLIMDVGVSNNEIATLNNYLSHFAYKIFSNKNKSLNYPEWKKFHETYIDNYEIDELAGNFQDYMRKLLSSRIIKRFSEERYSFSYNYALYFFTAQYLANNISESRIKDIIKTLIDNIHVEINANVLIFLSHLSKDNFILEAVISTADKILESTPALKMEDDIKELNDLMNDLPTLVFKSTSTKDNRKNYNEIKDSNEEIDKHYMEDVSGTNETNTEIEKNEEDQSLVGKNDILIQMDKAQRISEVIGQILKNYSGSILGEMKQRLLNSAYQVSLRAGNQLIEIIRSEKDELVSFISEKIIEDGMIKTTNQKEVESEAKQMVFKFVEMICFSIIQKSVKDTGTKALNKTYKAISDKDISTVTKLIISGSYLNIMRIDPSRGYIHEVFNDTDKNLMVQSILQNMVAKYLYLFELPLHERQQIASNFKIKYDPTIKARLQKN